MHGTCYPCRDGQHRGCPNHKIGTQGVIGRACDCDHDDAPALGLEWTGRLF